MGPTSLELLALMFSDGAEDLLASFFILLIARDLCLYSWQGMLFLLYEKVENEDGAAVSGMEFCPGVVK